MPRFKQLAVGEQPANPEKFILIEVIREPAIGYFYRVTGKGLGLDNQQSGGFHGLHPGQGPRTRSGIGQGCALAHHLPEQRHCRDGDVIAMGAGIKGQPLR
jgi:hypothetical protein